MIWIIINLFDTTYDWTPRPRIKRSKVWRHNKIRPQENWKINEKTWVHGASQLIHDLNIRSQEQDRVWPIFETNGEWKIITETHENCRIDTKVLLSNLYSLSKKQKTWNEILHQHVRNSISLRTIIIKSTKQWRKNRLKLEDT